MGAKWFLCPDGGVTEIAKCLDKGGCRMGQRCATVPYLRMVGYDREWHGISPSSAGTGPRQIYLKQVTDYVISPDDRAFAALGTAVHAKLDLQAYTRNVFSEEKLSDEEMRGISDVLEEDEAAPDSYVLSDYKTWGSYKVKKAMGVYQIDAPCLDEECNPIFLKSGPNKGQPKTKKEVVIDPAKADLKNEKLQLNRYRIFFESLGFPISRMQIQTITRDGNTYMANSRGIDRSINIIEVPRMDDAEVLAYYDGLKKEVDDAFLTGKSRICDAWESWDGKCCLSCSR